MGPGRIVPDLTGFAVPGREEALRIVPDIAFKSALPAAMFNTQDAAAVIETGCQQRETPNKHC